jgi:hypothetical protein
MSHYTSPTPIPDLLDPDEPTLFPRLTYGGLAAAAADHDSHPERIAH